VFSLTRSRQWAAVSSAFDNSPFLNRRQLGNSFAMGHTEQRITRAIVRPPASNFADGLTTARLGEPDYERALTQHEAYCRALERTGLSLIRLPPDSTHPDSTFVEDTAVIVKASDSSASDAHALPVEHHARDARAGTGLGPATAPPTAVLTRPGAASRLGEIESLRTALQQFFPSLQEIGAPGTIDGGDVCEAAGNHFFIGLSQRTNEAGAQQLAKMLKHLGYTSTTVDIRNVAGLLHLKSAMAYLAHNHLVVTESMADREEFANYDLVGVNSGDDYAANCVRVNEHVLIAAGYSLFESKLTRLGYQTIAVEMSEFQKMDGGLSCLSLRF